MDSKLNQIIQLLKKNLGLYLSISFGVFLFILFFQPFPLDRFDFNNRLLFVASLGGIVFLFIVIIRLTFNRYIHKYDPEYELPVYLSGFIILVLCSLAFTFYIRYVGMVEITFYIVFKIVFMCLVPPIILRLYDLIIDLKKQNLSLIHEKGAIENQVKKYKEDYQNKSIEFISENRNENLKLTIADVVLIQSAENYVEIIFKEEELLRKKLIRNTLIGIEKQLRPYNNFFRCHRTYIVNIHFIEKLHRDYQKQWISLKGYSEQIPVARQYLSKLKEVI